MSLAGLQSSWSPSSGAGGSVPTNNPALTGNVTINGVPVSGLGGSGTSLEASTGSQTVADVGGGVVRIPENLIINTNYATGLVSWSVVIQPLADGTWTYVFPILLKLPPILTASSSFGSVAPVIAVVTSGYASGCCRFVGAEPSVGLTAFTLTGVGSLLTFGTAPIITLSPPFPIFNPYAPVEAVGLTAGVIVRFPQPILTPDDIDTNYLARLTIGWNSSLPYITVAPNFPLLVKVTAYLYYSADGNPPTDFVYGQPVACWYNISTDPAKVNENTYLKFASTADNQYQYPQLQNLIGDSTYYFTLNVEPMNQGDIVFGPEIVQYGLDIPTLSYYSTIAQGVRKVALKSAKAPVVAPKRLEDMTLPELRKATEVKTAKAPPAPKRRLF